MDDVDPIDTAPKKFSRDGSSSHSTWRSTSATNTCSAASYSDASASLNEELSDQEKKIRKSAWLKKRRAANRRKRKRRQRARKEQDQEKVDDMQQSIPEFCRHATTDIEDWFERASVNHPLGWTHNIVGNLKGAMVAAYEDDDLVDRKKKGKTKKKGRQSSGMSTTNLQTLILAMLESSSKPKRKSSRFLGLQRDFLEFLLMLDRHDEHYTLSHAPQAQDVEDDAVHSELVSTLVTARQRVVTASIEVFWSMVERKQCKEQSVQDRASRIQAKVAHHESKSDSQLYEEAHDLIGILERSLSPKQYTSVIEMFRMYAGVNQSDHGSSSNELRGDDGSSSNELRGAEGRVQQELPMVRLMDTVSGNIVERIDCKMDESLQHQTTSDDDSDNTIESVDSVGDEVQQHQPIAGTKKKKKKKRKRKKLPQLRHGLLVATGQNFHRVAPAVADFFYMTATSYSVGDDDNASVDDVSALDVSLDPYFLESLKRWRNAKTAFMECVEELQELLNPHPSEGGDADDESLEETAVSMVSSSHRRQLASSKLAEERIRTFHLRRPVHLTLNIGTMQHDDATRMNGHAVSGSAALVSPPPSSNVLEPSEFMVFLENLPVDISEEELLDLYSSCGEIESCRIFNLRPDLDPGELTKSEIAARRKQRYRSLHSVGGGRRRWLPPRTPVYALLSFEDSEGYESAVDDALRIFGMMIRRHPVRSLPVGGMNTLYIEDLSEVLKHPPADGNDRDIELHGDNFHGILQERLLPLNLLVNRAGPHQNKYRPVRSCRLNFPSFVKAFKAYHLLQEVPFLSGATTEDDVDDGQPTGKLQWQRTRWDAEHWWTKRIGFY